MPTRLLARLLTISLAALVVVGITLRPTPAPAAPPPQVRACPPMRSDPPTVTDRAGTTGLGVVVRFRKSDGASLGAALIANATGSAAMAIDGSAGLYGLKTPALLTDDQYAAQLNALGGGLLYAEPERLRLPAGYSPPTDAALTNATASSSGSGYYLGARHWWLDAMHAQEAWALGQGDAYPLRARGEDIKIAVLDTGAYLSNPDLAGGHVTAGLDECASLNPETGVLATDRDVTPDAAGDPAFRGHGTAVAAIVGARCDGAGLAGIAWDPTVVVYKVAGPLTAPAGALPAGTVVIPSAALVRGIRDATDAGCRVINVSLCGASFSAAEQEAVDYARAHGAIVCASVGNDGDTAARYPAAYTGCLGVGAVERVGGSWTRDGTIAVANWSNRAPGAVDIVAPGAVIWGASATSATDSGYTYWQGTSFSSPAVAGSLAYLWRAMPDLSADQIVEYLTRTAADLGPAGRDDASGAGLADVASAYRAMIADWPMLATPVITTRFAGPGRRVEWTPVAGSNVAYQIAVDGSSLPTETATSFTFGSSVADGTHTVTVRAWSPRNWDTASVARQEVVLDTQPATVCGFRVSGGRVSWSVDEASPFEMRAGVDSSTPSVLDSPALPVANLVAGPHTVWVSVTDAAGNVTGPVSWSFLTTATSAESSPSAAATSSVGSSPTVPATVTVRTPPSLDRPTARRVRGGARTFECVTLVRWPAANVTTRVRIEAQWWERSGRGRRWVARAEASASLTRISPFQARARVRLSLPAAGRWRIRATTSETPTHAGGISSARTLRVR